MDIIRHLKGREVIQVNDPTEAAFTPLLENKKAYIKEIPSKTFRYRFGDRGELDVYYPLTQKFSKTPVLFFLYGGGFCSGDKSLSPETFGLVYNNVAAYFARLGYIVVIPDYRLVPQVVWPIPVQDVRDALRWAVANQECLVSEASPHPDTDNILMMGHSAGAAHIATLLVLPDVLAKGDPLREKIKAVVLASGPYDFSCTASEEWMKDETHAGYVVTIAQYWGTFESARENDSTHLLERLDNEIVAKLPAILLVETEFEPDFLRDARKILQNVVKDRKGEDLPLIIAKAHNHISLNWALCTGEGEEWAEDVGEWLHKVIFGSK